MTKDKTKFKKFRSNTFPVALYVASGFKNSKQLSKYLHKHKILVKNRELPPPGEGSAATTFFLKGRSVAIISVWGKVTPEIITHESVHCATYFCKDLGIATYHDEDEPLAYIVEWVSKCCFNYLLKGNINV
jgi:hypothetical protein